MNCLPCSAYLAIFGSAVQKRLYKTVLISMTLLKSYTGQGSLSRFWDFACIIVTDTITSSCMLVLHAASETRAKS